MVERWKKNLDSANRSLKNINFEKIIEDINNREYSLYDIKSISWKKYLHRIRIWNYRIIFKDDWIDKISILLVLKRWDIYKGLKNI